MLYHPITASIHEAFLDKKKISQENKGIYTTSIILLDFLSKNKDLLKAGDQHHSLLIGYFLNQLLGGNPNFTDQKILGKTSNLLMELIKKSKYRMKYEYMISFLKSFNTFLLKQNTIPQPQEKSKILTKKSITLTD